MDLTRNDQLLDRLACGYALGTLRHGARRRFECLAREYAVVRRAALTWQARIAGLTELQLPHTPDPRVWLRIERLLQLDHTDPSRRPGMDATDGSVRVARAWWTSLGWWRGATAAGLCATVLAVGVGWTIVGQRSADVARLQAQLRAVPQDAYVAVLQDDKSTASMLVTLDLRHDRLTLQRLSGYREPPDRSLQLWAIPAGGQPRSLGVLDGPAVLQVATTQAAVSDAQVLAVSLEPLGGVPAAGGPTGPVLFSGTLIRKLP
ncbi:MAG: anti-sigma factor [Burkholderiaceae bacterium]